MVRDLEASRDLTRTIVHLDMDMFYAAVEMRDDPTLRDKPMAVGGIGMLVRRTGGLVNALGEPFTSLCQNA